MNDIIEILKKARKQQGITLKELSEKYQVTNYDVILRIQYVRRINKKRKALYYEARLCN